MTKVYDEKTGRKAKGVLQIDDRGEYPFDSVKLCAEAIETRPDVLYRWIGDGKVHNGFSYEWEQVKDGQAT